MSCPETTTFLQTPMRVFAVFEAVKSASPFTQVTLPGFEVAAPLASVWVLPGLDGVEHPARKRDAATRSPARTNFFMVASVCVHYVRFRNARACHPILLSLAG